MRISNKHEWFFVNDEIYELINKVKDDQVILVGGAQNECIRDIYVAFKAFGVNVKINNNYVYSAKTDNGDSISDTKELIKNDKDNLQEKKLIEPKYTRIIRKKRI